MPRIPSAALASLMAISAALPLSISPAFAQYAPGWNGPGGTTWGRPGWNDRSGGWGRTDSASPYPNRRRSSDPREGKVEVSSFVAKGEEATKLGHGAVSIESESGEGAWIPASDRRTYEAAIVDALIGAGYDTQKPASEGGQQVSLKISRRVLTPAEAERDPVSGSAAMSLGTHGSAYGLAVNVDLSKPRSALVSTRLDTRILDTASGKVLWEGYATIATREGDEDWGNDRIALKLARALFESFPEDTAA